MQHGVFQQYSELFRGEIMALKKEITNEKGITSKYHMISMFVAYEDRIDLEIKSYADTSYRLEEKQIEENKDLAEKLRQQILEEEVKEEPDLELINNINQRIAELDLEPKDYNIGKMNYRIPFSKLDTISYANMYEKLKSEALFEVLKF